MLLIVEMAFRGNIDSDYYGFGQVVAGKKLMLLREMLSER